ADEAEREKRGIQASPGAICQNPYLLSEQDHGTNSSDAITLEAVDQAVLPEGDAARFQAARMPIDDPKRVRATAQTVLRLAADAGDTVLPLPELVSRIR